GYEHRRFYDNFWNAGGGVFRFIANPVHQIAGVDYGWTSDISMAYGMAAFMIGVNSTAAANALTTRAMNLNYHAAYIQHDFKLNSRLTLNLGLRWDMETPVTERFDKLYLWDPQAPAPFTINPGYNFNAAVIAAGLDPAQVRTPEWVKNGFPQGAIRVANTPEFPSRLGNKYHPWQFAPRLGVAYQLNDKTVLRGSFAQTYIPTTGSAGAFATGGGGVRLSDGADSGWHASNDNLVHMISSFANPYLPSDFSKYERTTQAANFQSTGPTGPSAFNLDSHMPYELTWSFGIQRELTRGLLVEGAYSGNHGEGLLGPDLLGRVPREIFSGGPAGQNARTYTTAVASPTAGQTLDNAVVGLKQPLAVLESAYPYFGIMAVLGSNIGRSNYHAFNLRAEQRLSRGLSFLANYTFSKSLDDVGGPNQGTNQGISISNLGGKRSQTVDPITVTYGLSPLDETHRFTGTFNYELPVGRGRQYMGSPDNFFEKVADYAIGGWELAGIAVFRSGRPIIFDSATRNVNNNIRAEWTYPSFATSDTNLANPQFSQNNQIIVSSRDPRAAGMVRRFDPTKVTTAQAFTYGTLPPIYGDIRHPGSRNYDLSLMKAFYFDRDGRRYLQFRMEASNVFNIRGFGAYNTIIGTSDFGLITSPGNAERNIQMSARIIF
ncbi:MAG: TonB-dependent receptor domain-containing protein, partial [Dongiaceae bacterium]